MVSIFMSPKAQQWINILGAISSGTLIWRKLDKMTTLIVYLFTWWFCDSVLDVKVGFYQAYHCGSYIICQRPCMPRDEFSFSWQYPAFASVDNWHPEKLFKCEVSNYRWTCATCESRMYTNQGTMASILMTLQLPSCNSTDWTDFMGCFQPERRKASSMKLESAYVWNKQ